MQECFNSEGTKKGKYCNWCFKIMFRQHKIFYIYYFCSIYCWHHLMLLGGGSSLGMEQQRKSSSVNIVERFDLYSTFLIWQSIKISLSIVSSGIATTGGCSSICMHVATYPSYQNNFSLKCIHWYLAPSLTVLYSYTVRWYCIVK